MPWTTWCMPIYKPARTRKPNTWLRRRRRYPKSTRMFFRRLTRWLRFRPAMRWSAGVGRRRRRTHDYVRHGITTLFAASGIADGTVISEIHRQHRAVEFRKFLATIDKTVPEGLGIHLICDNYGTHKTPAIKAWLARHPRVKMHFTPTGSSWINQVERWFGFLTDQMIRRGAHKSVQAL